MFSDRVKDLEGSSIRAIFKMLADRSIISFAGEHRRRSFSAKSCRISE